LDQSGHPGKQITGGKIPVWASKCGESTHYVAPFNLTDGSFIGSVKWSDLGFASAESVTDVWGEKSLGSFRWVIPQF